MIRDGRMNDRDGCDEIYESRDGCDDHYFLNDFRCGDDQSDLRICGGDGSCDDSCDVSFVSCNISLHNNWTSWKNCNSSLMKKS